MFAHCTLLHFAVLVVSLMTGDGGSFSVQHHVHQRRIRFTYVSSSSFRMISDDSQFILQLLNQQENSVQVSVSNSSASDLNCSDLVQSDGETSIVNTKGTGLGFKSNKCSINSFSRPSCAEHYHSTFKWPQTRCFHSKPRRKTIKRISRVCRNR